jgi:hypothetical protein
LIETRQTCFGRLDRRFEASGVIRAKDVLERWYHGVEQEHALPQRLEAQELLSRLRNNATVRRRHMSERNAQFQHLRAFGGAQLSMFA